MEGEAHAQWNDPVQGITIRQWPGMGVLQLLQCSGLFPLLKKTKKTKKT